MTLYKIVGPKGEVIATINCQALKALDGKNRFEIVGFAAQVVGEMKLHERCAIEIVGGIMTGKRKN